MSPPVVDISMRIKEVSRIVGPRQVFAARNIRAGRLSDYIFGALSCQIEHHLFPAMPRYRLREAAPIVRRFCEERGIAYRETGVLQAYADVHRHLRAVALPLRRATPRPVVQELTRSSIPQALAP